MILGARFTAVILAISLSGYLLFAYADEPDSYCEECQVADSLGEDEGVGVLIITDTGCDFCATQIPQAILKQGFPRVRFNVIDYKEERAGELIDRYQIQTLPYFIIDPLIKEEGNFDGYGFLFKETDSESVLLKKEISGICFYLDRKKLKNKIDFFLDLYKRDSGTFFNIITSFSKENNIDLDIHFVDPEDKTASCPKEETRAALAVRELYPDKFNDYVYRRIMDIKNTSWITTVEAEGLDDLKIRDLMASSVMDKLNDSNERLANELEIKYGSVILIQNNRIFKVFDISKEELSSFFK